MESKFNMDELFKNTLMIKELKSKIYIGCVGDDYPNLQIEKEDIILWFKNNFKYIEIIEERNDK